MEAREAAESSTPTSGSPAWAGPAAGAADAVAPLVERVGDERRSSSRSGRGHAVRPFAGAAGFGGRVDPLGRGGAGRARRGAAPAVFVPTGRGTGATAVVPPP